MYEIPEINFDGPLPPLDEAEVEQKRFNQHIRPAEVFEKAAGYVESMGALRALQEAMSGLYFNDFWFSQKNRLFISMISHKSLIYEERIWW